jgi:hypothetical protein
MQRAQVARRHGRPSRPASSDPNRCPGGRKSGPGGREHSPTFLTITPRLAVSLFGWAVTLFFDENDDLDICGFRVIGAAGY